MIKGLHDDHDMYAFRHNQGIQGNHAHQGSDKKDYITTMTKSAIKYNQVYQENQANQSSDSYTLPNLRDTTPLT